MSASGIVPIVLQIGNFVESLDLVVVITVVFVLGMIFALYLMLRRTFVEFMKGMRGE